LEKKNDKEKKKNKKKKKKNKKKIKGMRNTGTGNQPNTSKLSN